MNPDEVAVTMNDALAKAIGERDQALAELDAADRLLVHAFEWIQELGCDCGTDEPDTCAYCRIHSHLRARGLLKGEGE